MTEFEKFEVGDLVFANDDHYHIDVEAESPGLVVDVHEEPDGTQVEIAVQFYPDNNEVRFAPHELTIVGREGKLDTMVNTKVGDRIMMVSPYGELVKILVEDVLIKDGEVDVYGVDADDEDEFPESETFKLGQDVDVFKVSA